MIHTTKVELGIYSALARRHDEPLHDLGFVFLDAVAIDIEDTKVGLSLSQTLVDSVVILKGESRSEGNG